MINKESEDAFSKGNAAFSFNGSWAVNVYKQLGPDLNYTFFSLPQVSSQPAKVWGGAGSSFMINAHSPNAKIAIEFLKWLTSKEQQEFLIRETNNLPAIKGCEDTLSPTLKSLLPALSMLTHPNVWPDNEDSQVIEVMNQGLQQIVMGIKTPEQLAKEIEEKKQRVLRK
jgi:raffinose/stachyose/melibiose transport system substrate-binding protein